jgi:hypothetical protein
MEDSQRLVTLIKIVHHDPEGHDIGELFEGDVLALHLPPDRIGPLDPT